MTTPFYLRDALTDRLNHLTHSSHFTDATWQLAPGAYEIALVMPLPAELRGLGTVRAIAQVLAECGWWEWQLLGADEKGTSGLSISYKNKHLKVGEVTHAK